MDIIDISPSTSPEPRLELRRSLPRQKTPLFLPEEPDVIELSDSNDEEADRSRTKRRRTDQGEMARGLTAGEVRTRKAATCPQSPSISRDPSVGRAGPSRLRPLSPPSIVSTGSSRLLVADDVWAFQDGALEYDYDGSALIGAFPRTPSSVGRPSASSSSPIIVEDALDPQAVVDRQIAQVCEIFPDALPSHVAELLEKNKAAHQVNLADAVVQMLVEGDYPKIRKDKGKATTAEHPWTEGSGGSSAASVDYTSVDRVIVDAPAEYRSLALAQLEEDFLEIPKQHIKAAFDVHNKLYVPTFLLLEREKASNNLTYVPNDVQASKAADKKKKGKGKAPLNHTDFMLERAWLLEKRKLDTEQKDSELARELEEEDDCVECGCCFAAYSFSKMIQCPETHLFCTECVTAYASTRLGEQNHKIQCMDVGGCTELFTDGELRRVLPAKLLELYERVRQRHDVEEAEIEGLEECPFCEFKIVFDQDPDTDKLFRCQNEDCSKVSCRKCRKEDHLPKSCAEAEEDKKLDGRHAVEEAMTRALMRNCPRCQKAFIKDHGCNKMVCPNCQTMSCYVCRKVISGYDHFSERPGAPQGQSSKSNGCPLWDQVEARHADEVAAAAKQAQEEYKTNNPDAEDKDLHVDLPVAPPPPPVLHHRAHVHVNPPLGQHAHVAFHPALGHQVAFYPHIGIAGPAHAAHAHAQAAQARNLQLQQQAIQQAHAARQAAFVRAEQVRQRDAARRQQTQEARQRAREARQHAKEAARAVAQVRVTRSVTQGKRKR